MISRSRLSVFSRPGLVLGLMGVVGCEPATLPSPADDPDTQAESFAAQSARPPSLTRIDPVSLIAGSDGELTITGKGFVPGLSVSVGGRLAVAPRVVTATKIQVALPPGVLPSAATAVKVTLADGRSGERTDLFSIVADPVSLQALQPVQRFPVSNPRPPAVADFNLDGRPDVAMISQPGLALTMQLSTLAGGSVTTTGPTIAGAYNVFAAELNADGKPDLVVTTQTSPSVGVLLGKGDGTFQPATWLASAGAGFSPYQHNQIASGDYNADGKTDLIIGDVGGTIFLAAGNGDGTFATAVTLAKMPLPVRGVRLANLDADPGLEIIAVGGIVGSGIATGSLVTVARQLDGTSKVITNTSYADNLYALAVADYDGDGKNDVATIGSVGKLQLYHGNGDATFVAPISSPIPAGGSFLLTADLNGDGKADFISGGRTDDALAYTTTTISLGNGDGTVRSSAVMLETPAQDSGAALSDMDKDGRLDLVLTNGVGNELEILTGRSDGTFISLGSAHQATASTLADLNADGKADLVYVNSGQNKLSVALGDGGGTFSTARVFDTDKGPSAVATGDFNADGKLDVAVTCYDTNLVSLLLGNGDGTFAPQRTFTVGKGPNALVVVDLDGDGKLDVVTANTDSDNVSVLLGNGTGNFAATREYAAGKAPTAVAAGDLNADGKLDIVTSNSDSNNLAYLQGGTLTPGTLLAAKLYATGTAPSAISIADVNGDGKLDVVTVNSDTSNLALHAGRGDGTFAAAKFSPTCEFPISLAVAELTGDGKQDAVVQCAGGRRTQAMVGVGDGSFIASPRTLPQGSNLTLGDINADMKLDLVIPDGMNPIQVFLNTRR